MEVDSGVRVLPVAGGCGIGFSPLLESFPSEDEGSSDGVMVVGTARGKPIAVSDLCRGSVRDTVSVADALTPAEAENDRRRDSVDGAGTVEGDMGKGMIASE